MSRLPEVDERVGVPVIERRNRLLRDQRGDGHEVDGAVKHHEGSSQRVHLAVSAARPQGARGKPEQLGAGKFDPGEPGLGKAKRPAV